MWLCALAAALLCAPPVRSSALEWQEEQGVRSAPLPGLPARAPGFTLLLSLQTGITFINRLSAERAMENQIRLNGSGVAAGDVDGDGWCDLYFCGLEAGNRLYRNLGQWEFADITEQAGVSCGGQYSTGAVLADVEGDGDLDLLVTGIGVGVRCFLNDGAGRFTEATGGGLIGRFGATSMALADIDRDGDLDLYVANYRTTTIRSTGFAVLNMGGKRMIRPQDRDQLAYTADGRILEFGEPDVLYRNEGGAQFRPVPWTGGVFLDEQGVPLPKPPLDWGLSAMFRDLNGDGAPDLYVCNDFQTADKVWINRGDGQFRLVGPHAFRKVTTFSMCVDVGDVDRDGHDDIFVADMLNRERWRRLMQLAATDSYAPSLGLGGEQQQVDRNTLQLNRGDGTYAEVAQYAQIDSSDWTWAAAFIDVDLDGYEDLLCSTGHLFNTQDLDAEAQVQARGPWRREDIPKKLLLFPELPQAKVAFRNRGDLTFELASAAWGFDQIGTGHGIALADLDNDGDLDVIVNNLNTPAGIYRNECAAPRLAVRLQGAGANTRGVGARIRVSGGPVPQSQEIAAGGRYLSGDDAMRVFAAGSADNELDIEVAWASGKRSFLKRIRANRLVQVIEPASGGAPESETVAAPIPGCWFEDTSRVLGHAHQDDLYADFARQPLLPKKLSQLGPGVAWFDVNGDGWEDLVIGSGKGGRLGVFKNEQNGSFSLMQDAPFSQTVTRDQTGIAAWREAKGPAVVFVGSSNYEDGLAAGGCLRQYATGAPRILDGFPGHPSSTGPLALGDMDGDGHLELCVGGRVIPGRFPEPASSLLFRHRAGKWALDDESTRVLRGAGLVSGAIWSDLDGDSRAELVLACEWGPIRIYTNRGGTLREVTADWGLDQLPGWWTGINAGDFDGDGQLDLLAANWGLNGPDRASAESPLRLFYDDLDNNGTLDLVEATRSAKEWLPTRDLPAILAGMPFLGARFPNHLTYSRSTVADLAGDKLASLRHCEAVTLASTLFLNRRGRMQAVPLPREAQFAPAFGVAIADFDGDGREDAFLSQNFFSTRPQMPRFDAGRGLLLQGDGAGGFRAVPAQVSGVVCSGEQRGCAVADYDKDGRPDLVVTQNAARTSLFRNVTAPPGLRVRLTGPAGNSCGYGVCLRLQFGERWGPAREVHGGGGYWSQDAAVVVLATPERPSAIEVRWPGAKPVRLEIPDGAREIEVTSSGQVRLQSDS